MRIITITITIIIIIIIIIIAIINSKILCVKLLKFHTQNWIYWYCFCVLYIVWLIAVVPLLFIGAENLPLKSPVQVKGLEISETELLVFCLFFFKDLVIPIKLQSISLIYRISSIVQDNYSFSRWVYLWLQKDITKFKITSWDLKDKSEI